MKTRQTGFTMIELIVVIVILGILAATALPKFIDMRGDASRASLAGVAGAAASAMNLNFAGCALTNHAVTANKCSQVNACSDAQVGSLMQGGLPAGYTISGATSSVNGDSFACAVANADGTTAAFNAIAAGN